ncbi:MAG: NUDIX hydrolase [Ilumatobacteraceae bacterium]
MIEAAGGVIWRHSEIAQLEILLIHRPRRGDWSLPKGKLELGESALRAAAREVREETGLRCSVGPELPATTYLDRKLRDKRVRYWAMRPISGRFKRSGEVDMVRWTTVEHAASLLTNDHDIPVVAALFDVLATVD